MPRKLNSTSPRTGIQRERDIKDTVRMYLKGYTLQRIVDELQQRPGVDGYKLSVTTIRRDIDSVRDEWKKDAIINLHEHRMRELERIDSVEAEAWIAWDRSCEQQVTVTVRKNVGVAEDVGGVTEESTVTHPFSGDPRYLAIAQKCVDQRTRLLGLDAPVTVDLNVRSWYDIMVASGEGS